MTGLRRAAGAMLALTLACGACGTGGENGASSLRDRVKVSGDFGEQPTVEVRTPLEVGQTRSWTVEQGQGARVGPESTTILQLTIVNGRTGRTALSTFAEGQRPLEAALGDQVFPSLAQALTDKSADSRVVLASTAEEAYGDNGAPQIGIKGGDPVVVVADILSTDPAQVLDEPTGDELAAPTSAPVLEEDDGSPTGFDFSRKRKPKRLVVVPLREGTGPEVEAPDRIAAHYLGQVWGAPRPFQETYTQEPATFTIGLSKVVKAWDRALAGQKEGARVLVIAPPRLGYGGDAQPGIPARSTLVFVVDVLGVG